MFLLFYIVFKRTDAFGRSSPCGWSTTRVYPSSASVGAELSARDLRGDARKIIVWTISIAFVYVDDSFYGVYGREGFDRVEFLEDMNRNDFDVAGRRRRFFFFTAAAKVLASVRGRIVNSYVIGRSESSFGDRRFERNRSGRGPFQNWSSR